MRISNSGIIYDCEITKCIPQKDEVRDPHLDYCGGWNDFAGMGISCICTYDYMRDQMRVYTQENLDEFAALVADRDHVIGFNSQAFNDKLCHANGIQIVTTYDIQVEVWRALGQPLQYTHGVTREGLGLGDLAKLNFGTAKSGDGGAAPRLWQEGRHQEVIGYCRNDVRLTKRLLESWGYLKAPEHKGRIREAFALKCPPLWDKWDGISPTGSE